MKKLILNPKKTIYKKNIINVFPEKFYVNFLNFKKLNKKNFQILSRKESFRNIKNYDGIFKKLLDELYPQLNKIHNISWNYKAWFILIGPWLYFYIFFFFDKTKFLKKIVKSNIDFKNLIKLGKHSDLSSFNFFEFKKKIVTFEWYEIFIARILYILNTKNFNIQNNLLVSGKNINNQKKNTFFYHVKVTIIKFFERIFCFKNNYLFYNSYIYNKNYLFKIFFKLKNFPFKHSFLFFNNNLSNYSFNSELRKKINLNFNNKNLELKILKILLIETIPTIYIEGFKYHFELAKNSHLPKKIKNIFTSSSTEDSLFKFWLSNQANYQTNIYHGQHGAGFYMYKKNFFYDFEKYISKKRFTWGTRLKKPNEINVGNYLLNKKNQFQKLRDKKKYLILLPRVDLFKPLPYVPNFEEILSNTKKIIKKINHKNIELNIREHPKVTNRQFSYKQFINIKLNARFLNPNDNFEKTCNNYSLLIFSYMSTAFLNQLAFNKPCMVLIDKDLKSKLNNTSLKDFEKLSKEGIAFFNANDMSKKINNVSYNLIDWWESKATKKARINFCKKYSNPNFNYKRFIKNLS